MCGKEDDNITTKQLWTCHHLQHGRDTCLIWLAIYKNSHYTRRESTTGHEKSCFTVILSCVATKLKLMVIFKRKTQSKEKFHLAYSSIITPGVGLMQTAWSSGYKKFGVRDLAVCLKIKSLLVWESFWAHLGDPLKQVLPQTNTDIAVIPSGLTSVLQPLDVCLNNHSKTVWEKDDMVGRGREKLNAGRKCKGTILYNHDFLGFRGMVWSSRKDGHPFI